MISRRLAGWCKRSTTSMRGAWRRKRHRRLLTTLTDWQLADAGIDPSLAGRGRAIATRYNPSLEGLW